MQRTLSLLCLILAVPALAEDAKAKAAREELERQLNQMVGKAPTRVRIDYAGLDEPNYQIEEATFELDGRRLGTPTLRELSDEGTHLVWNGDVTPGKHTVKVLLVFANASSIVVSDEGGYKWRVGGDVSFDVHSGIEVHVTVTPKRDPTQADIAKRFKLALPAKPVMLAQLDDGKMPEPPKPVVLGPVDAGTPPPLVASVDEQAIKAQQAEEEKRRKAEEAAEVKRLAAEEKKRKAEEAAEAKRLAAEEKKRKAEEAAAEKKRKAEEAAEARRLAAEEKKRKAAEAAEAKRLAAEEKKRLAEEAKLTPEERARRAEEAKLAAQPPVVDAGAPVAVAAAEPVDAGAPEVVDAGAPVAVAQAVLDAGAPVAAAPTAPAEEGGPPWLYIGIGGGVLALALLVVLARRSAKPPTLDD